MSIESKNRPKAVYNRLAEGHCPPFELWRGIRDPHYDKPEISVAIFRRLVELNQSGVVSLVETRNYDARLVVGLVHDLGYIDYLRWLSNYLSTEDDIPMAEIVDEEKGLAEVKKYKPFAFPFEFAR